jgi:hypothetical protein
MPDEITFQQDIKSRQEILRHLQDVLEKALQRAAEKQLAAYTLINTFELLEELIKKLMLANCPILLNSLLSPGIIKKEISCNPLISPWSRENFEHA